MVALSCTPTCAVPETTGSAVRLKTPSATETVGGLVADPVCEPDFVAVTLARRRSPSCAAVGLNALVVAPAIGVPLASHW